jgi:UDP-2,3-diacylglucosamine pyrophosphatase LpxH
MKSIIVSDLHIGSPFFLHHNFAQFLQHIPEDVEFILNGDIIDSPFAKLGPADQGILERFGDMSLRQRVVWVRGNHDNGYIPDNLGKIEIKKHHALGKRLFIAHGDLFDEIMPQSRIFIKTFQMLHDFRIKLGARPVHVAQYAKKWTRFYAYLRKSIMLNAVNYARINGFSTVTCGHTHYPENQLINGIRYINTGAWTETPGHYVQANGEQIILRQADQIVSALNCRVKEKLNTATLNAFNRSKTNGSSNPRPSSNQRPVNKM